jgi:hypothetical protein
VEWARPPSSGFIAVRFAAPEPAKTPKKKASKKPGGKKPPPPPKVEKAVVMLMAEYQAGLIDNVNDVMMEVVELSKKLPADSPFRPAFDEMHAELERIWEEDG